MRRRGQGGFTLIEIMVSMGLLVIGLLGIVALHATMVKGNRVSRQLERARVLAVQEMEILRGMGTSAIKSMDKTPETIETTEGTTYTRRVSTGGVGGSTCLIVTVKVSYADDSGEGEDHSASMQMIRTTEETM